MASPIRKRTVSLSERNNGRVTSVSLEDEFWNALTEIASFEGQSITRLITRIAEQTSSGNLSSAIRVHVMEYYRSRHLRSKSQRSRPQASRAPRPSLLGSKPVKR